MYSKINPDVHMIKSRKSLPLSKKKIKVAIVGVFNSIASSSIYFERGFRDNEIVEEVIKFDYRKEMAENYNTIVSKIIRLSNICDLLIIQKGNNIPLQTIQLASRNCRTLHWFPDWYPQLKRNRMFEFSKYFHYRTATGYGNALRWAKRIKLNVYHVIDGSDINTYKPVDMEKEYDVSFIGGRDNERDVIYKYLKDEGFKVKFFGPGYTQFIYPDKFREICSKSKAVLNLSRGCYEGYSSLRLWNILACGSMVFTKTIPNMTARLGIENEEQLIVFESLFDLKQKLIKYLNDDNYVERLAIGEKGREFVKNNRTWHHVANELLDIICNDNGECILYDNNSIGKHNYVFGEELKN